MKQGLQFDFGRFTSNRSLETARSIYEQRIADALAIYERHHLAFVPRPCPFCGHDDAAPVERFRGTYGVDQCRVCAGYFVNPAPGAEALQDYYNNCSCNSMLSELYKVRGKSSGHYILGDRVLAVLDLVSRLPADRQLRILEIGCNSGSFLAQLRQALSATHAERSFELVGIDIDANAVRDCVDDKLRLIVASAEQFTATEAQSFDIIVHFELIEHLQDPFAFMTSCRELLSRGGFMLFTTPNVDGLESRTNWYNSFRLIAHAIFPPMHLNAFGVSNLTHFAIRSGFQVVSVETPGRLDVDMVAIVADNENVELPPLLRTLAVQSDEVKGLVQHLMTYVKASSHMQCVLRRGV